MSLKNFVCSMYVFIAPTFTKPFVLECDTSGIGLEAVLTQEGKPLAFTGKKLCDFHLGKSTYEKEMMVILHVVNTYWPYLLGSHFKMKTYHHSLKYFLEQRLSSLEKKNGSTKCWARTMK